MRSKCSFILKATTALALALLMLFGTVATSLAAIVKDDLAGTGAEADLAATGYELTSNFYWLNTDNWWNNSVRTSTNNAEIYMWWSDTDKYTVDLYHIPNTGVYQYNFANNKQYPSQGFLIKNDGNWDHQGGNIYTNANSTNNVFYGNGTTNDTDGTHVNGTVDITSMISFDQGATYTATTNTYIYTSASTINVTSGSGSTTTSSADTTTGSNGKASVYPAYGAEYTLTASSTNVTFYGFSNSDDEAPDTSTTTYTKTETSYEHAGNRSDNNKWYAYYKANTYGITFNLNGGTLATTPTYYAYGKGLTLPTPTRTGYTFAGWFTESNFSDTPAKTTIAANSTGAKTFYAKWTENKLDITVASADGDMGSVSPSSVNVGITTGATATATPETGYSFDSWAATGKAVIDSASANPVTINTDGSKTGTGTVTASFTEDTHTVSVTAQTGGTVDIAGGKSASATVSENSTTSGVIVGYHTPTTLTATPESGYKFTGWTYTGTYDTDNETVAEAGGSVELTAQADGVTVTANFAVSNKDVTIGTKIKTSDATGFVVPSSASDLAGLTVSGDLTISSSQSSNTASLSANDEHGFTVTANEANGYEFVGWYTSGGTLIEDGDATYTLSNSGRTITFTLTDATNIYAYYKRGADVVFKDYDGTTVLQASSYVYYDDTASYSGSAPTRAGYTFQGWDTNVDATVPSGISGNLTADTTYYAIYNINSYSYTYGALAKTDGGAYVDRSALTGTLAGVLDSAVTATYGGSEASNPQSVEYNTTITFTASNSIPGWEFVGWVNANSASANTAPTGAMASTTLNITAPATTPANTNYYALYKKIYHVTVYSSWLELDDHSYRFLTSPARHVLVYRDGNTTTPAVTYTYSKAGTTPGEEQEITATGNYTEGNMLKVLAGDVVNLDYSNLASSEVICSSTYNNAIRYTYEGEPDNKYFNRAAQDDSKFHAATTAHPYGYYVSGVEGYPGDDAWSSDYAIGHALFADPDYYDSSASYYSTMTNNYNNHLYPATIDQNNHLIQWTIDGDYWNIMIELGTKKRFIFSDTDNTTIVSENFDNYYLPGDAIGASTFSVAAAKSSTQTNKIVSSGVGFYHANADGTKGAALTDAELTATGLAISSGTSTSTSAADGTALTITGTKMPGFDIYVDLGLESTAAIKLHSKMQSDMVESKTRFNQVATITGTYGGDTISLAFGSAIDTASSASNVTVGDSITLSYTFGVDNKGTADDTSDDVDWSNYYMFIGWYKANADGSAPDFENGYISNKNNFPYKVTENTTVFAIGTRDLFINGSKYLFADDDENTQTPRDNWNNYYNYKMTFDPSLGTQGKYYYEISDAVFAAASNCFSTQDNGTTNTNTLDGFHVYNSRYYWNNNTDSKHGNAFFQLLDTATGNDNNTNKSVWAKIHSFKSTANGVTFGKILPTGWSDDNDEATRKEGQGFITFTESAGYSSPLRIYYNPDGDHLSVEPTYVYPNLYVSNGYKGIDTASDTSTAITSARTSEYETKVEPVHGGSVVASGNANYFTIESKVANSNYGWRPYRTVNDVATYDTEGRVYHYQVQKKDATVRVSRKVSGAGYKVAAFNVYDTLTDELTSYTPTAGADNTYYVDLDLQTGHDLYIIPIIEDATASMKVIVDSSDLKTDQWGDFIACYAWYQGSNGEAYGTYPGQMMVRSSDGNSWTAKFAPYKQVGGTKYYLVGITFSNYYDSTRTWLGGSGVLGTATQREGTGDSSSNPYIWDCTSGIVGGGIYNYIKGTDSKNKYGQMNCKVQTYDYREPFAMYLNEDTNGTGTDTSLSFKLKSGDTGTIMSMMHSNLTNANTNIFNGFTQIDQNDTSSTLKLKRSEFDYLTNSKGDQYVDLNGTEMGNYKPTPTYYIVAKGMATYSNAALQRVFYTGNAYEAASGSYPQPTGSSALQGEVSQTYAVQWYIYDGSGNYITNILSAGFGDRVTLGDFNSNTIVAQKLLDMGYAVENRSVAIAYDNPRYCYGTANNIANSGSSFDAYRFTGQWYKTVTNEPVTVDVKVGMLTDNGEVIADGNSAGYGNAYAQRDGSVSINYTGTLKDNVTVSTANTPGRSATVALADAEKKPIKLTADTTNFDGWYYYADKKLQKVVGASATGFYPDFTQDSTYYAMYKASANYQYTYAGREGTRSYSVSGGDLTAAEMGNSNILDMTERASDFSTKAPGDAKISIYQKTIVFDGFATIDNSQEYFLKASIGVGSGISDSQYTLTYYYPNRRGDAPSSHTLENVTYNTLADLSSSITDVVEANAPDGESFIGWYEYNASTQEVGELLSAHPHFGYRMVGNLTIIAQYASTAYSNPVSDPWKVYIDDHAITREMVSATEGTYYSDTIFRVRDMNSAVNVRVPEGSEVGILIIRDDCTSTEEGTHRTTTQLENYASRLGNGKTARISGTVLRATKIAAGDLTSYNRADLSLRSNYSDTYGQHYSIYAYAKIDGTYYFSDATSGIYN